MSHLAIMVAALAASGAVCYLARVWRQVRLAQLHETRDQDHRLEVLRHEHATSMEVTQHEHRIEEMERRVEIEDEMNRKHVAGYNGMSGRTEALGTDEPDDARGMEIPLTDWRDPGGRR